MLTIQRIRGRTLQAEATTQHVKGCVSSIIHLESSVVSHDKGLIINGLTG